MHELKTLTIEKPKRKNYSRRSPSIKCICPKCEKMHNIELKNWVGKIPARKFCKKCKELIELYNETLFTFGVININEKVSPSDLN